MMKKKKKQKMYLNKQLEMLRISIMKRKKKQKMQLKKYSWEHKGYG